MSSILQSTIKIKDEKQNQIIEPKVFLMWLIIIASIMLFAGFTSAYIVRRGEGNWDLFNLPVQFLYNSIISLACSATMIWANYSARKLNNLTQAKISLFISLTLGVIFCLLQIKGWESLVANSVYLVGNPSGSFVYVISGLHLAHVVLAILFILFLFIQSLLNKLNYQNFIYLRLGSMFWHFVGALWIYLYLFLTLYR